MKLKKLFLVLVIAFTAILFASCQKEYDFQAAFYAVTENIDVREVTEDLQFVKSYDGVTIEWMPDNSAIDQDGKVTRGNEDVNVTITVIMTKDGVEKVFELDVVVKKIEEATPTVDLDKVFNALKALIPTTTEDDLSFPASFQSCTVTWSSKNQEVIANDGKVTRGDSDQVVAIDVKITSGELTKDFTLSVTVKANDTTVLPKELDDIYAELANTLAKEVTTDMTLPTEYQDCTLTWNSSNVDAIANDGKVTRGTEDQVVTLTVTFKRGEETKNYTINVTVKALANLDTIYQAIVENIPQEVTANLNLVTKYEDAVITWQSSNTDAITNDGIVSAVAEDSEVTLTIIINCDGQQKIYTYAVVVKAQVPMTVLDVHNTLVDEEVDITGTVTFVYTGRGFYLTDETASIYVYDKGANTVAAGDVVSIQGVRAEYNGTPQIAPEVVTTLSSSTYTYQPVEETFENVIATTPGATAYGKVFKTEFELVASGNYVNAELGDASTYLYNAEETLEILRPLVGKKISATVVLYTYNETSGTWSLFVVGDSVVDLTGDSPDVPPVPPVGDDPVAAIGYQMVFNTIQNKEVYSSWSTNEKYAGMSAIGNPGQGYAGYAGFGRSGDKDSTIVSVPLTFTTDFKVSLTAKGNPSNNSMGDSYFLVVVLDADKNVIATGIVVSDSQGTSTLNTTQGRLALSTDSNFEFVFTAEQFVEGKGFADAAYIGFNYKKDVGNMGMSQFSISEYTQSVTPDPDPEPQPEEGTIAAAKQLEVGTEVTLTGVVTGLLGRKVYIEDATGAISLYNVSEELLPNCVLGQEITIKGLVGAYNLVIQITNVSEVTITNATPTVPAVANLDSLATATLEASEYKKCNITVSFVSISKGDFTFGADTNILISDGVNELTLYVSKYLDEATHTAIKDALETAVQGDTIVLNNVFVTYFKSVQIEFVEGSSVVLQTTTE